MIRNLSLQSRGTAISGRSVLSGFNVAVGAHVLSSSNGWMGNSRAAAHVEHLADLTAEELITYGPLAGHIAAALREVLQATKVYMVLFADSANAPHLHIHFIPRSDDLPPEYRGPEVFRLLGMAERDEFSGAEYSEVERIVNNLRDALNHIQGRVWNQE